MTIVPASSISTSKRLFSSAFPVDPHSVSSTPNLTPKPTPAPRPPLTGPKVLVTISHPSGGSTATFRTHPSYPVSKLVVTACKTFRLPREDCDRARLLLLHDPSDPSDSSILNPASSLAEGGVREGSAFALELA